ncbi:MAG: hypothetical protein HC880_00270 [Bacteroidia bacterium]|nr:hypothetical protein [Bacteroidia bacterium]
MSRVVRKDHMITYQGNRYSLPLGSYQPKRWVYIREQEEQLLILDEHRQEIARHRLSHQKGQNIINTHHQRDQQAGLPALTQALVALFTQTALAEAYLAALTKQTDPRYRRDQLSHIQKTLVGQPLPVRDQALAYCTKMAIYSARDLADVVRFLAIEHRNQNPAPAPAPPGPRPTIEQQEALQNQKQAQADKSSLQTYEAIFHQSKP